MLNQPLRQPLAIAAVVVGSVLVGSLAATSNDALPASANGVQTQVDPRVQKLSGHDLFRTYCASCHGLTGAGDGPVASSMRRKPANLQQIAKRNGGEYPSELVYRVIDGRQPVRGHGGPDMPVWGDAFARTTDATDEESVKRKIDALVAYLKSIQELLGDWR
jgi:mono/diheme cytochrome c family protein